MMCTQWQYEKPFLQGSIDSLNKWTNATQAVVHDYRRIVMLRHCQLVNTTRTITPFLLCPRYRRIRQAIPPVQPWFRPT